MASQGARLVVGVDYGTTYTGLAWMADDGLGNPKMENLMLFKQWPRKQTQKVPSEISYSRTLNRRKQWGHDIDNDSLVLRWTKMDLEPREPVKELSILGDLVQGLDKIRDLNAATNSHDVIDLPQHLTRNSADVVRDYLSKVVRAWYIWFKDQPQGQNQLDGLPLDVVITHPAGWSYLAMNKTYRAVLSAFSRELFPKFRNTFFISEPEACALFTVRDLLKKNLLKNLLRTDGFVLCDAGGGTVDVVSYRVESVEPFKVKRLGEVAGSKCGATFTDRAFLNWILPKLKDTNTFEAQDVGTGGHFVVKKKTRALINSWDAVKVIFAGDADHECQLYQDAEPAEGFEDLVVDGVAKLSNEDLRQIFSFSVQRTVDLVTRQIAQAHNPPSGERPCEISHVFLAGGFAENNYLCNEVKRRTDQMGGIDLRKADDCWSGVVKGAVLAGVGFGFEPLSPTRPCPRHYGFCVSKAYAHWKDNVAGPSKSKYSGEQMAADQLVWIVNKGDAILPDKPLIQNMDIKLKFSQNLQPRDKLRVTFVATALDPPPTHISKLPRETNEVAVLEWEFRSIPGGQVTSTKGQSTFSRHYTADIIAEVQIQQGVTVEVKCGGTTLETYHTTL